MMTTQDLTRVINMPKPKHERPKPKTSSQPIRKAPQKRKK